LGSVSLVLTSRSGLQALSVSAIRLDFDFFWWLPNVFPLVYPLFFLKALVFRPAK